MVSAGLPRVWVCLEALFMIEPIMYFGIGFLVAALVGLVVVPLVHGRAVRLTMRRLEAATPLSMAEIQADKDQLRSNHATSHCGISCATPKKNSLSRAASCSMPSARFPKRKANSPS